MSDLSRRRFLHISGVVGGAALLGGCSASGSIDGTVTPQNGTATLSFAMYPKLASVGGGVVVDINGQPIAVLRTGDMTAAALSAVCTHAGCTVEVQAGSAPLFCACHGSEFAADGTVTRGPARQSLRSYAATVDANGVNVSGV